MEVVKMDGKLIEGFQIREKLKDSMLDKKKKKKKSEGFFKICTKTWGFIFYLPFFLS
jgi:hypothetical protein